MQTTPDPTQEKVRWAEDTLSRLLNYRRQYDSKRLHWYRQYVGQQDPKLYPDNTTKRANTFVKYPLSNVEQIVARTSDAFFSFDPWHECTGVSAQDDGAAEAMQTVLHQKLQEANFIHKFEDVIRTGAIYDICALKVDWDWDYEMVFAPTPPLMIPDPQTGQPAMNPQTGQPILIPQPPQWQRIPHMRPKFIPIDVFDLLIDPDGQIMGHMTERTLGQLKRDQENYQAAFPQAPPLYFEQALAQIEANLGTEKDKDLVTLRIAEIWNGLDNSCTQLIYGKDSEGLYWKDTRAAMRAGATRAHRRQAYNGKTILLWAGLNPFEHKKVPILFTSYIKLPGEVYGMGAVETISEMVESLNNFVNMITDNWNLGINRRYAYDTNAEIDHEALNMFNTPGGKIGVNGDPNNVIKELPFFTPQQGDYMIVDLYRNMIENASGVSDFYSKGVGSPTGNRTATGISNVMQESNYRFRLFIRNLEIDILQPMLRMCAAMVQQFCTDDVEVSITDAPPGIPKYQVVPPSALIGSFHFNMVAANYATNKMVRQRNFLAFANVFGESPYWRQREAISEAAKIFEIRNINRLLKSDQEVQMEQAAAQQQQMQMMIFEAMLQTESQARLAQSKPRPVGQGQGKGGGRPAKMQFEGKIPGAGLTSIIREMAQGQGANALGLEGLGEAPSE